MARVSDPNTLKPRAKPGSVIHDTAKVVERAIKMVRDRQVIGVEGSTIALQADTMCLHGDTPGAAALAAEIRRGLESAGIQITALRS